MQCQQAPQPRLLLWLTFVSCLLFTGPVFGFGALQTVMERDGEYAHLCDAEAELTRAGRGCPTQETALALIYAAGGTVPFWAAPTGFLVDLIGPTRSSAVAGLLVSGGALVFGLSSATAPDDTDLFALSYLVMGAGGCLAFMCTFPVSFLFPEKQGQVLALTNCLFDASSALFLPLQLLHGWEAEVFSRRNWFIATAVLAASTFAGLTLSWRCSGAEARFSQIKMDNDKPAEGEQEEPQQAKDRPAAGSSTSNLMSTKHSAA